MGRIRGHYEWDDDGLTPGRKREGGLHQNLFDKDGNLKGNARFIPSDGDEDDPIVITETVYIPIEQRRRTPDGEAFQQAIADLVSVLIDRGIAKAKPYAQQFWRETARPALAAQRSRARSALRRRSLAKAQRVAPIAEVAVVEPASQIATAASGRHNRADHYEDSDLAAAVADRTAVLALAQTSYDRRYIALVRRARALLAMGDKPGAYRDLEAILQTPDIAVEQKMEARLQRAELHLAEDRASEARADLQAIVQSYRNFDGVAEKARTLLGEAGLSNDLPIE